MGFIIILILLYVVNASLRKSGSGASARDDFDDFDDPDVYDEDDEFFEDVIMMDALDDEDDRYW